MSSDRASECKAAKSRDSTTSVRQGFASTRNLNNYGKSHQSDYSDPVEPFKNLLTSVRVTSHEMELIQSMLNTPSQGMVRNSLDNSECEESTSQVRQAASEFLNKSPSADNLSLKEYDFSRAPPGVLEEVANIEVAWKAWNWTN